MSILCITVSMAVKIVCLGTTFRTVYCGLRRKTLRRACPVVQDCQGLQTPSLGDRITVNWSFSSLTSPLSMLPWLQLCMRKHQTSNLRSRHLRKYLAKSCCGGIQEQQIGCGATVGVLLLHVKASKHPGLHGERMLVDELESAACITVVLAPNHARFPNTRSTLIDSGEE
jgi:hypothetical protein